MPLKLEDIVHVEQIRSNLEAAITQLNQAIAGLNTGIKGAFGEMSFGLLTVIEAHNTLEARLEALEQRINKPSEN